MLSLMSHALLGKKIFPQSPPAQGNFPSSSTGHVTEPYACYRLNVCIFLKFQRPYHGTRRWGPSEDD